MTGTSLGRCRSSVLAVLCTSIAAVFLTACGGDQPTVTTAAQPTATPTVFGGSHQPEWWYVSPSLEGQIYDALTYDSFVIVRASLLSATAGAKTVPGEGGTASYRAAHQFRFTIHEYLEGNGPTGLMVVALGERTHPDEESARNEASYTLSRRNGSWDDRQAVLFLGLAKEPLETPGSSGESEGPPPRTASFSGSHHKERWWDYSVDTLSRAWLPAQATASGATDEAADVEFITDGSQATPTTITLADLKAEIAALEAELDAGRGVLGFRECVSGRILHERINRSDPLGPLAKQKAFGSGLMAGTEVFRYNEPFGRDPVYSRGWLSGADAGLFEAVTIDDDTDPFNGYNLGLSTERPLPAGEYRVHYNFQHHSDIPCNFKPEDTYFAWTVTVTAPTGTLHETLFDPVDIGLAVGADAYNGVLEPTAFTVGGTSTSLQSLKWESGSVTLGLSAEAPLSGHFVDFIDLDGTAVLSLDVGAAAVSGGTLTWSVASQPWEAGDQLMLRIREA